MAWGVSPNTSSISRWRISANRSRRVISNRGNKSLITSRFFLLGTLLLILSSWLVLVTFFQKHLNVSSTNSSNPFLEQNVRKSTQNHPETQEKQSRGQGGTCNFREYPPHRYYGSTKKLPEFLLNTEYIFGNLPTILPVSMRQPAGVTSTITKLCVDQSEWHHDLSHLPFADGTNPSIVHLKGNHRLDEAIFSSMFGADAYYLLTICMTNSQCSWNDTPDQKLAFHISPDTEPATTRNVLLVLNQNFETLEETTIRTLIDAPFGRRIKPKPDPETGEFKMRSFPLDDARLFTYQNELWISYREGAHFGYDKQVLHPVHLQRNLKNDLTATLKASEVSTLCCGRNMALIDNVITQKLQALTWVDPITVVDVDVREPNHRKLLESTDFESESTPFNRTNKSPFHRRLSEKKSDFHGTNGFMVYLPATKEYLGIGHFHRPPGREANDYARFGHHYTHAFFTIPDTPPFYLKRLSPELLLPSYTNKDDAEIIQFWSGIDLVDDSTLALAYGINDCEGAATYVDLATVEGLLQEVPQGKEVVDLLVRPKVGSN